jgi:cobalt-zinc-cadmium efflux system outer membrane protein
MLNKFKKKYSKLFFAGLSLFAFGAQISAQEVSENQTSAVSVTTQYVNQNGTTVENLVNSALQRRADVLAARQRLNIAQARLLTARQRPNPTLEAEYGTPRFLGGEAESDLSVGISQGFELFGKRSKRIALAELEIAQTQAELAALERQFGNEIRLSYAKAIASARQLETLERLVTVDEELLRITDARLKEGDVAPLDLNLVRVEAERLRVQIIDTRSEIETELLSLRALIGLDVNEDLRLAPLSERPPRLDLPLSQLTEIALRERSDLQAARLAEQVSAAQINLANAEAKPNIAGSVKFSRSNGIIDLPERIGGGFIVDKERELTFGVSIDLPIFNRNKGAIAEAVSGKIIAQRQREFLEANIKKDVAVAYRKYRAASEKLVIFATQILPRAEANLTTIRAAYNEGEFSLFEVISEQRKLSENVREYNDALRDYYEALTGIENSLGVRIPPEGFAPNTSSVLPDKEIVPQIEREKFLRGIFKDSRKDGFTQLTKKQNEEEKK